MNVKQYVEALVLLHTDGCTCPRTLEDTAEGICPYCVKWRERLEGEVRGMRQERDGRQ